MKHIEEECNSKLPKTWEESIKLGQTLYVIGHNNNVYNILVHDSVDKYRTASHSRNQLEAIIALNKLIWLRDIYNEDWKPDWNDPNQIKYRITITKDGFGISKTYSIYNLFCFKSNDLAFLFIENFKNILKQIKDLY